MKNLLVLALLGLLSIVAACDDGDSDESSGDQPTQPPTGSSGPTPEPDLEAIESARIYLQETGIDGRTGDLTDPLNCPEITDDTDGDYCIHQGASIYALGLVILVIGDADDPDEAWEMRLAPTESAWEVTSVEPYG
jgi:hypothetical protein